MPQANNKLPKDFYLRHDVVEISKDLLGKKLCTQIDGVYTSGIIVESEAYSGRNDKACHAYLNRRTKRTEIFYDEGGIAYVYLCYGIHHLFNIITNKRDEPDAILIRAVEPVEGVEHMHQRRNYYKTDRRLTGGPGSMSKALGITTDHYGTDLQDNLIWIENHETIPPSEIMASPRVGIDYAEEDALLPWRFRIKRNRFAGK